MKINQKTLKFLAVAIILILVYFVSRLINLTALPIFTDEAIYIRWAQIAKNDSSWRFISLTDGKQPLLIWLTMVSLKFISDPLAAGRIVSVFAGFFSLIGIYFLAFELFKNKKIAFFASLFYLVSPFSLMYDRMALMDAWVGVFYIWSMFFAIRLAKKPQTETTFLLAMSLGGGVLTKTSGFLSIYLLPTTLLFFDYRKKSFFFRFAKWFFLVLLAVGISQVYYSVLRLSPWFHMIGQKDETFVYTFSDWLRHPLRFLDGNLNGLGNWLIGYLTIPLILLFLISLFLINKKFFEKVFLLIWFAAPFFALALFGKVLYPRFILFMTMPVLVLTAWSLEYLISLKLFKKKVIALLLILVFLTYPLYTDLKILFSIVTAPIPLADSGQYINDWPAGWGIREVVDILGKEAKDKKIAIYTEGTFGLLPYGVEIYLVNNPNVEIIGIWPIPHEPSAKMIESAKTKPTYYIANQFQDLSEHWKVKLLSEYQKGNRGDRTLRLYRFLGVNKIIP